MNTEKITIPADLWSRLVEVGLEHNVLGELRKGTPVDDLITRWHNSAVGTQIAGRAHAAEVAVQVLKEFKSRVPAYARARFGYIAGGSVNHRGVLDLLDENGDSVGEILLTEDARAEITPAPVAVPPAEPTPPPPPAPVKCIIYTRFSPRPDSATSDSCEIQQSYCLEYARRKGYAVEMTIEDPDVSGSDEYRERLWKAINSLKKGWVLLVHKRDRLARNVYLSETINRTVARKGGRIEAVSGDVDGDGPEQQLIRQVVAAMAEYERKLISKRTSDSLRAKQKSGHLITSRPPYGYMIDPDNPRRIIRNDDEQKTCDAMLELHRQGVSFNAIAKSIPPESSRVGHWSTGTVRNIILRLTRPGAA